MKTMTFCLMGTVAAATVGCTAVECATPDYTRAECRVLAENEHAEVMTSTSVQVSFQTPGAKRLGVWEALGLVEDDGKEIRARVASLGAFTLALHGSEEDSQTIQVALSNVHPRAKLRILGESEQELLGVATGIDLTAPRTERRLSVEVPAGQTVFIQGDMECPRKFRLLALADMQTNPTQFKRIVDKIQREYDLAQDAGELLAGVVMAGDLTESSTEIEFRQFMDLLAPSQVPFAVTAGNHDVYDSMLPYFTQNLGPGNYSFNVCRAHVAMLDTGSGTIAASVLGRLPELFHAPNTSDFNLAVMHHPPYAAVSAAGWSNEEEAMTMLGEFAYQRGDLIFAGHAHMLESYDEIPAGARRIREIIAGTGGAEQGPGEPIYGFVRLSFGEEIDACFVEVPAPGAAPTTEKLAVPRCADTL